jgi:hypothetical protein
VICELVICNLLANVGLTVCGSLNLNYGLFDCMLYCCGCGRVGL